MRDNPARGLWLFFVAYWDDHITNPSAAETVCLNARTVRVLRDIYGGEVFEVTSGHWLRDGDIRILGDFETLAGDAPCIEVLGYAKEYEANSGSQKKREGS
jgi:hypothetical protein